MAVLRSGFEFIWSARSPDQSRPAQGSENQRSLQPITVVRRVVSKVIISFRRTQSVVLDTNIVIFHLFIFNFRLFLIWGEYNIFDLDSMGDISSDWDFMAQSLSAKELSSGWSFKQTDDSNEDAWLPVKSVPSEVHQDLIDNNK